MIHGFSKEPPISDHLFWLSEEQFARLKPLLPNKVRGVPRVDDQRVISGIMHVLKSGWRWVDARLRATEDALQPVGSLGGKRGMATHLHRLSHSAEPLLDLLPPEVNIVHGDKGYDSNVADHELKQQRLHRISRRNRTNATNRAFSPALTRIGTRLSVCSKGSRTFVALAPDTTDELMCISQRSSVQQPSPTGYESGP